MYRIQQLREERNLSQRELSKRVGASARTVNFWENQKADPSARFVCALADYFEVSTDYLLGREDEEGKINIVSTNSPEETQWLKLIGKLNAKQSEEAKNYIMYLLKK